MRVEAERNELAANWIRWSGSAAMLGGVLWALWYVGAYFVGWGSPSIPEYDAYEIYNRSMPVVLLVLLVGLAGAQRCKGEPTDGWERQALPWCLRVWWR